MNKYKKFRPHRFDRAIAAEGVWFECVDEVGNEFGSFKLKLVDETNPLTALERTRIEKKYRLTKKKNELSADEALRLVMCEMSLCAWKLPDGKGKLCRDGLHARRGLRVF